MLKLHVKTVDGWKPVFCKVGGRIVTCEDSPHKALPPHSRWAQDDLKHFQNEFGNNEFSLIDVGA
jgi:hypothetical protein